LQALAEDWSPVFFCCQSIAGPYIIEEAVIGQRLVKFNRNTTIICGLCTCFWNLLQVQISLTSLNNSERGSFRIYFAKASSHTRGTFELGWLTTGLNRRSVHGYCTAAARRLPFRPGEIENPKLLTSPQFVTVNGGQSMGEA
jgi:hypothetical protein